MRLANLFYSLRRPHVRNFGFRMRDATSAFFFSFWFPGTRFAKICYLRTNIGDTYSLSLERTGKQRLDHDVRCGDNPSSCIGQTQTQTENCTGPPTSFPPPRCPAPFHAINKAHTKHEPGMPNMNFKFNWVYIYMACPYGLENASRVTLISL